MRVFKACQLVHNWNQPHFVSCFKQWSSLVGAQVSDDQDPKQL